MNTVKQLVETIKEGIQEKKGQDIVIADLTEIDGSIAKYFIICQEEALLRLKLSQVLWETSCARI